MILTKDAILNEVKLGTLVITPFDSNSVGAASIDLSLSDEIRVFNKGNAPIEVDESIDFKDATTLVKIKDKHILQPGEFIIAATVEKLTLPCNIAGFINSRSRFARVGLMTHATSPFINPGISNIPQILEISNAGPRPLALIPGTKICQVTFVYCKGSAKYTGTLENQRID